MYSSTGFLHSVVGRWPEYSSSVIGRRRQSHCSWGSGVRSSGETAGRLVLGRRL